jgi:hypothetical protein
MIVLDQALVAIALTVDSSTQHFVAPLVGGSSLRIIRTLLSVTKQVV